MEKIELSIPEIAERLKTTSDAARKRLKRHGYEPSRRIGVNNLFKLSNDDIEFLKQQNVVGKPKAAPEPKPAPKKTTKRSTKKD